MKDADYTKRIFYILGFFAVVLLGTLLKITAAVSLPVTVAVLLSCVLYPVIKNLNEKLRVPWVLGSLLMMLLIPELRIEIQFDLQDFCRHAQFAILRGQKFF